MDNSELEQLYESLQGYKVKWTFEDEHGSFPIVSLVSRNTKVGQHPYRMTQFSDGEVLDHVDLPIFPTIEQLNDPQFQKKWMDISKPIHFEPVYDYGIK